MNFDVFFSHISALLSMLVPHLDLMITLVGSLASSMIALVIPPVLETIVTYPAGWGAYNWRLIRNVIMFVFGLIGLISGTAAALIQIAATF